MDEVAASCADHPRRRARATCSGCGRLMCRSCKRSRNGEPWCEACLAARGGEPSAHIAVPAEPPDAATLTAPASTEWGPAPSAPEASRPVPVLPPGAGSGSPPPLPSLLIALVALQAVATFIAAWSAWRVANVAEQLSRPTPAVAVASPSPVSLRSPSFDLRSGITLRGAPVRLQGEAPFGEIAVLLVDGRAAVATVVEDQRFAFDDVPLSTGSHELAVKALDRAGTGVESAPVFVRYELAIEGTPAPGATPAATPAATAPAATPATPSPRPSLRPPAEPTRAELATPPGRVPRNVLRGRSDQHIALTFDGGSEANQAVEVLDALASRKVRSTLFLTGEFIAANAVIARRIVADGHEVGNHSFSHPHLADWSSGRGHLTRPGMSRELLLDELERTDRLFEEVTGRRMSRFWRAPYGEVNNEILRWAAEAGWIHVGWTEGLDTLDWVADPGDRRYRSARQIRDRILNLAREGSSARGGIVLMHLGGERASDQPVAELPRIIDGLRNEGYRLVTVSALLGS